MKKYFDHHIRDGIAILSLRIERLLFFESAQILNSVEAVLADLNYPDIVIDLSSVEVMDSAGVGFLISVRHLMDTHKRQVAVVSANEGVQRVLHITNMESFLKVFTQLDEAVASFGGNHK